MKINYYLFLCLAGLMATTACKKSGTSKPGTTGTIINTDVYVAGTVISKFGKDEATYWKNVNGTTLMQQALR